MLESASRKITKAANMTANDISFSNPTKVFGNDVVSLVQTYSREIISMNSSSRGNLTGEQIRTLFIAYVSARNTIVFSSFKDIQLGMKLWRLFMEELLEVSSNTGDLDAVFRLTEVFYKQLNENPTGFDNYFIENYKGASKNTTTNDELIWVRNFISAIGIIDRKYNETAEKFGFF
jgi:hypothetical protein